MGEAEEVRLSSTQPSTIYKCSDNLRTISTEDILYCHSMPKQNVYSVKDSIQTPELSVEAGIVVQWRSLSPHRKNIFLVFACSPMSVWVFSQMLQFPPTNQNMQVNSEWIFGFQ